MLYLEDYVEIIEHLPQELRDRFTEMREMDLQVQNAMDSLEEREKQFFLQAKKLKPEQRDAEYEKIRQDYYKVLDDADEKVQIANQVYDLVDRYLRRLDQELAKFKMELEADNAGITEILERRSLELDKTPPTANHMQPKAEKRKYSAPNSTNHCSEKRVTTAEKVIAVTPDVLQESVKYRSSNSSSSSSSSTAASSSAPTSSTSAIAVPTSCGSGSQASGGASGSQAAITYSLGHMGAGSNAIAAAASQAIAATQQMQQGRRTASLKASFEVVNSGLQGFSREFSIGRDLAPSSAAATASAVVPNLPSAPTTPSPSTSTSVAESPRPASSRHKKQVSRVVAAPSESPIPSTEEFVETAVIDENGQATDWSYDPNEPRYCVCNQVSYGDMVACDNEDCPFEWFHYACVGISQPPKGKWYCPQCTSAMKRRGRK